MRWLTALVVLVLVGCGSTDLTPTTTRNLPTSIPAPTPLPALPTVPPLGSEENPIRILITVADMTGAEDVADDLSAAMSEAVSMTIEVQVTDAAPIARQGVCGHTMAAVTLDAFTYLDVSGSECGLAAYVVQRGGQTQSQGQFIARDVFLPDQYRGVFCRPDANSMSGWIIPTLTLKSRNVNTFVDLYEIIDAGSDEQVIRMVDEGVCVLGATSIGAEQTVRDLRNPERLHVLEELTPVPYDVVVISNLYDPDIRDIVHGLITANSAAIATLMGGEALVPITDADFANLRTLFEEAGVNPSTMGD